MIDCVYWPPGNHVLMHSVMTFSSIFEYLFSVSQNFLICGAFNVHVDMTSKDSEKVLNCLESCNINQHVREPTHLH